MQQLPTLMPSCCCCRIRRRCLYSERCLRCAVEAERRTLRLFLYPYSLIPTLVHGKHGVFFFFKFQPRLFVVSNPWNTAVSEKKRTHNNWKAEAGHTLPARCRFEISIYLNFDFSGRSGAYYCNTSTTAVSSSELLVRSYLLNIQLLCCDGY